MNAVAKTDNSEIMEQVIIKGDLSKLTPQERTSYYMKVCESVGLNPLTKPFEYIALNGKLTLYALKACTEQLRGIHDVSVTDLAETLVNGVFIVTAKVKNGEGRTDAAKGAVPIDGLKGENLANAMMKAETKAKRRATLSLCGLGWLDESEIESIPGAKVVPNAGDPQETTITQPAPQTTVINNTGRPQVVNGTELKDGETLVVSDDDMSIARSVYTLVRRVAEEAKDVTEINECLKNNAASLKTLERASKVNFDKLKAFVEERRASLAKERSELNDDLTGL